MIYCKLVVCLDQGYTKSFSKNIDSHLGECVDKILNNYKYRMMRISCLKNLIIHLQFELNGSANGDYIYDLNNIFPQEIKSKFKSPEFVIMIPVFMEQCARYSLLKKFKNLREYIFMNVNAANTYTKDKNYGLPQYGRACLVVATKFYDLLPSDSWGYIIELAFYNLAGIYYESKTTYLKALDCYLKVVNNAKVMKENYEISKKALEKVKLIYKEISNNSNNFFNPSVSLDAQNIVKKRLDILKIFDADLVTQDEVLIDLNSLKKKNDEQNKENDENGVEDLSKILSNSNFACKYFYYVLDAGENVRAFYNEQKSLEDRTHSNKKFIETDKIKLLMETMRYQYKSFDESYLLKVLTSSSIVDRRNTYKFSRRKISLLEPLLLVLEVESLIIEDLTQDFSKSIIPIFNYVDSEDKRCLFPENSSISPENTENYFDIEIIECNLPSLKKNKIIIQLKPKKIGQYMLKGINWEFWGIKMNFDFNQNLSKNFYTFRVLKDLGVLNCSLSPCKNNMLFGEVITPELTLKNTGEMQMEDVMIYSHDPLFTGFELKRLGSLEAGSDLRMILRLRATLTKIERVKFLIFYRNGKNWRIRCVFIEMLVRSSTRIKSYVEIPKPGERLICVDFLYKTGPSINWSKLKILGFYIISNAWDYIPDSEEIISDNDNEVCLIYFNMKKRKDVDEKELMLDRTLRKVFLDENNMVDLTSCKSKDFLNINHLEEHEEENYNDNNGNNDNEPEEVDLIGLDDQESTIDNKKQEDAKQLIAPEAYKGFLEKENLELRRTGKKEHLCKNYIDICIVWTIEDSGNKILGFNSVTSLGVNSTGQQIQIQNHSDLVKIYIEGDKEVYHDFSSESRCRRKFSLKVDLSTIDSDVDTVLVRALQPNEFFEKDGSISYATRDCKLNHVWVGRISHTLQAPFSEDMKIEFEAEFPEYGLYNINNFLVKDLNQENRIFSNLKFNEEFIVEVKQGLI